MYRLSDLFTVTNQFSGENKEGAKDSSGPTYVFRGFVCYYGLHYVSIFQEYSPGAAKFLLFDDQRIRPLGSWEDVKMECVRSCYQPVLLLYELEKPDATVDTITAPSGELKLAAEKRRATNASIDAVKSSDGHRAGRTAYKVTAGELDSLLGSPISPNAEYLSESRVIAPHLRRSSSHVLSKDILRPEEIKLHMRAEAKDVYNHERVERAKGSGNSSPSAHRSSVGDDDQSSLSSMSKATGPPEVMNWGRRPVVYRVTLFFEKVRPKDPGPGVLGLDTGQDSDGHLIVAGFYNHPVTGGMLPAERNGRILLMDRLLAIDNTPADTFSTKDASEFLSHLKGPATVLTLRYVSIIGWLLMFSDN
jgi:hypothetical protein